MGRNAKRIGWVSSVAPVVLGGIVLSGCAAVGPNFKPPQPPVAHAYASSGDKSPAVATLTSEVRASGPWWRAMGSPKLDEVMTRALAHNQTVAAAQATLEKAKALAESQHAALAPNVQAAAGYTRERIDIAALGFPGFPSPTIGLFSIGPTVSYDLDLVGGQRRRVEQARANQRSQAGQADAAYLTLTGNVALEAVKIAAYRAQIDVIRSVIADDRQSIEMVRKAQAAGGDSASATLGGQLQLEEDLALLPPLEQQEAQAKHALAMLVGEAPSEWTAPDFSVDEFTPPGSIPVAVPSALVRQRPDIQAAEAQLHADTAAIGVQTARLYPDVRLVAGLTQEGLTGGSLFGFGGTAYNFGPTASLPIFDGGVIRADRRAAQAQARLSLARYRQTVVAAFVQVADVLSALGQDEERLRTLERAVAASRSSLDDATSAYRLGGGAMAGIVVADRQWREASLERVGAVGQRLADIIALYGATAADWGEPTLPASADFKRDDAAKRLAPPRQSP
jgi:NodT family efflux transporter outer membrane factor (OMF) lipoprotein